ncbi:MAG: ribose-phosphate pyrophosphokinase [Candidatus Magasanikbacteria bacterium]
MGLKIISGSSHKQFTRAVCEHLGIQETKTTAKVFSNENRFIKIEEPVRGDDVFVIQTQASPVDAHIMELLMIIRTLRDASAKRITAVLPYLPYIRSDKKDQPRVCLAARLMADMLQTAGANRALIMEMHSPQTQGFFSIPTDHIIAAPDIVTHLKHNWDLSNYVLIAGDSGAAKLLQPYADSLHLPVAIMDKRRMGNEEQVSIKGVIGDVHGKKGLIIDDETSSGGTLIENTKFLLAQSGVLSVDVCFIHAALGKGAVEKLNSSPIGRFITTDTIPLTDELRNVEIVSVAGRFAEFIQRIHDDKSVKSINDL